MDDVLLLVAGGVIAAVSAWIAAWINNRGADDRLKRQFDRDDRRRKSEYIDEVKKEPAKHLETLVSIVSEYITPLSLDISDELHTEATLRVGAALYRARVSMIAIDETGVRHDIDRLSDVLTPFTGDNTQEAVSAYLRENSSRMRDLLAVIDGHRRRLLLSLAAD